MDPDLIGSVSSIWTNSTSLYASEPWTSICASVQLDYIYKYIRGKNSQPPQQIEDLPMLASFIAVLLIRHFKHRGGLVLPPLLAARMKQDAHEEVLRREKEAGRSVDSIFIRYPKW